MLFLIFFHIGHSGSCYLLVKLERMQVSYLFVLCLYNRDMETVLREDREALRSMQKHQPRFTEDQKRELSQVHPWIRTGRLPRAINISVSAPKLDPEL